jgi:hypothetical protein
MFPSSIPSVPIPDLVKNDRKLQLLEGRMGPNTNSTANLPVENQSANSINAFRGQPSQAFNAASPQGNMEPMKAFTDQSPNASIATSLTMNTHNTIRTDKDVTASTIEDAIPNSPSANKSINHTIDINGNNRSVSPLSASDAFNNPQQIVTPEVIVIDTSLNLSNHSRSNHSFKANPDKILGEKRQRPSDDSDSRSHFMATDSLENSLQEMKSPKMNKLNDDPDNSPHQHGKSVFGVILPVF